MTINITLGKLRSMTSRGTAYDIKFHPSLWGEVDALPNFTPASAYKSTLTKDGEVGRVERFTFFLDEDQRSGDFAIEKSGA